MRSVKRAAAVLGVALAVAACSSDDDGSSSEPAATATEAPATTTTEVGPTPEELADAVCAARPVPDGGEVRVPELAELSGLVSLDAGLWAHNDSGDSARIFRLTGDGTQALGTLVLEGVEAIDWEDMSGAGPSSGELFVGDIGDNEAVRPEVQVHRVEVPDPPPEGTVTIPVEDIQTITLHYPNGARDAETLLVDPVTRDLVIVHKRFGGASEVYVAAEDDWSDGDADLVREGVVEVGDTPLDATTGGDIGLDGRVVALRTYAAVLVFPREDDQSVAEALAENAPCDAPSAIETQGEAIAFTPTGYVTIGEGEMPPVHSFATPEIGQ
jgi:hypothetical protein